MTRRLALRAKVLGGLDDAGPEILLPILIDHNARGEWVGRVEDPLCQSQTVTRQVFGHGRQERGNTRRNLITSIVILTAAQDKGVARLGHLRHDHSRADGFFELALFFSELYQLSISLPVLLRRIVR